jgi:methyl-accepting chemotaxis protein
MKAADDSFQKAYGIARNNITLPGEQDHVDRIIKSYDAYKALWLRTVADSSQGGNLDWYFSDVHPSFLNAKGAVSDLMNLNNQAMYNTASHLENRAYRATMPGIVAIVAAFIFAIIFSFLVNLFIVNPIIKLTSNIEDYLDRRKPLDVRVETDDEISKLISSVEQLIRKSEK